MKILSALLFTCLSSGLLAASASSLESGLLYAPEIRPNYHAQEFSPDGRYFIINDDTDLLAYELAGLKVSKFKLSEEDLKRGLRNYGSFFKKRDSEDIYDVQLLLTHQFSTLEDGDWTAHKEVIERILSLSELQPIGVDKKLAKEDLPIDKADCPYTVSLEGQILTIEYKQDPSFKKSLDLGRALNLEKWKTCTQNPRFFYLVSPSSGEIHVIDAEKEKPTVVSVKERNFLEAPKQFRSLFRNQNMGVIVPRWADVSPDGKMLIIGMVSVIILPPDASPEQAKELKEIEGEKLVLEFIPMEPSVEN